MLIPVHFYIQSQALCLAARNLTYDRISSDRVIMSKKTNFLRNFVLEFGQKNKIRKLHFPKRCISEALKSFDICPYYVLSILRAVHINVLSVLRAPTFQTSNHNSIMKYYK